MSSAGEAKNIHGKVVTDLVKVVDYVAELLVIILPAGSLCYTTFDNYVYNSSQTLYVFP